jgi:hypothetical protein
MSHVFHDPRSLGGSAPCRGIHPVPCVPCDLGPQAVEEAAHPATSDPATRRSGPHPTPPATRGPHRRAAPASRSIAPPPTSIPRSPSRRGPPCTLASGPPCRLGGLATWAAHSPSAPGNQAPRDARPAHAPGAAGPLGPQLAPASRRHPAATRSSNPEGAGGLHAPRSHGSRPTSSPRSPRHQPPQLTPEPRSHAGRATWSPHRPSRLHPLETSEPRNPAACHISRHGHLGIPATCVARRHVLPCGLVPI